MGTAALLATSVVIGLTDLDALTLSLARSTSAASAIDTGAAALAAGVVSNTILKMMVAAIVGRGPVRRIAAMVLAATTAGWWIAV